MEIKEPDEKLENRILDAARGLFFRQGIKSISMDDIAGSLGISKKTIYQFYKDKKALVNALMQSEMKLQLAGMQQIRMVSENPVDEMLRAMQLIAGTFSRIQPVLFYDLQKYYPIAWQGFKNFKDKELTAFVEENLRRGIELELYRKDLKIKILARFRLEQVEMGLNPISFPPEQFQMRDVQLAMLEHFLHGVVTLKGHKLINKYKHIQEEE